MAAYLARIEYVARVGLRMNGRDFKPGQELAGFGEMDPARLVAGGQALQKMEWLCGECGQGFPRVGLLEAHHCKPKKEKKEKA